MALWQFKIALIPATYPQEDVTSLFFEDGHDTSMAWENYGFGSISSMCVLLDEILPRGTSWNKGLLLWGDERTNDIQLWSEGTVDSLNVRFDLRSVDTSVVTQIVNFSKKFSLNILLLDKRKIIAPDVGALLECFSRSEAASFVRSPKKYLLDFSKKF